MGNCATCDDPSIYEANTETKPTMRQQKKTGTDNQENQSPVTMVPHSTRPKVVEK